MADGLPELPPGFVVQGASQQGNIPPLPDGFVLQNPTLGEYGLDVAKSAGIGAVKGAIGLAGITGDARELIKRGAEKLTGQEPKQRSITDLVTGPRDQGEPGLESPSMVGTLASFLPGFKLVANAPTSSQVRSTVEGVTGPLYEPKTAPGRVAETFGEMVPAGLAGPGGVVRKVAANMVAPTIGATAGERLAPEGYEQYGKAAGTLLGGVAGAALPGQTVAQTLRGQLPDFVTDAHIAQAGGMIQSAAQQGINLTWPEALSRVVGRPIMTNMQRVLESAPQTRQHMEDFLGDRAAQVADAGDRQFANIVQPTPQPSMIGRQVGEAADQTIRDTRQAINRASEPFYQASENVLLTPAEMTAVRAIPGYAAAARAVRADPQLNRYVEHLPEESFGFLNEVKKYLNQAAENAASPVQQGRSVQRSAGLERDAGDVRGALVNASDRAGAASYQAALDFQTQARARYLEPLLAGPLGKMADKPETQAAINALFPSKPLANTADEISTAVSALAQRNPWAARQLVRAHLEQQFNQAFERAGRGTEAAQFAGAGFAARAVGNPLIETTKMQNVRAAVQALPNGNQVWDGFNRLIEVAQATGMRMPKGSLTAFNEQELQRMAGGSNAAEVAKLAASPGKWWNFVHNTVSGWQYGRNMDQLAAIITDPASARVLQRIATLPRGSVQQGQILMSRALAQTYVSTATQPREPARQGQQP